MIPINTSTTIEISEQDAALIAHDFLGMDTDNEQVQEMIEERLVKKFPGLSGQNLENAKVLVMVTICLESLMDKGFVEKIEGKFKLKDV